MKTVLLAITLLASQTIFSQKIVITPEKKEEIKIYIKHFEDSNQLMGTVSIFQNAQEVVNETFGEKNNTSNVLAERKYTIGSITKLYVAVLFAKLQEEEKINFEENLSSYFPEILNANKIEIRQMLNHTSGLKDYASKADSLHFWLKKPRSTKEIMDEIVSQGVAFQPGDSLSYSNSAYYLLGRILEIKHQKPFAQILTDEITIPLQLMNTFAIAEENNHNSIAKSYEKKRSEWIEMEEFYFPNVFSAGSITSTALDMNTFLSNLFTNKIIKEKTLQAMLPNDDDRFGLGMIKFPFFEHIGYGHGGDTYGTHSVAVYNRENKLAVTYIINGENYPTNDFAIGLLSIIFDKEYTLPEFKEYIADKKYFELYEGVYGDDGFPMTIKIYTEVEELKAEAEGQSSFTLTPTEKHVFEFAEAGIEIEFKPSENKFILKQAGHIFELKKE
jgi:D-alanyl-D-alanine carboxypeptidase